MAVKENALTELRDHTSVDCDTMDADVARDLGPFEDCTSNQAIAYNELLKPKHQALIEASVAMAQSEASNFPEIPVHELAVEIAMVKLQLLIVPLISGCVHVQTNTYASFSVAETVANAKRIIHYFKVLSPSMPASRVCIKIPSTWEGMLACQKLESEGIYTLATTLFSLEQAALAAEVGCRYVAPYVNELKVHFDISYKDTAKLFDLCLAIQRYYELHSYPTQVLPASLTSTEEIMILAGVHHITISPQLLLALSQTETLDESLSIFGQPYSTEHLYGKKMEWLQDEAGYRAAFTQSGAGNAERKLSEAINIFNGMQDKLELMMKAVIEPVA